MRRKLISVGVACWLAIFFLVAGPPDLRAEEIFITIGSGDIAGVYFPVGLALARMLNEKRPAHGMRAAVEATNGSTFNLKGILAGYLEFGLAQSDTQHQAVSGRVAWQDKGPQSELRSVFSLHHEALTLVAAVDAGITTLADLRGKRVSLGNPGISEHRIVLNVLEAAGIDPKRDIIQFDVMASDAPVLMEDNRIDAYFFTVGHPSETIYKALSGKRKARIVPISGPGIDRLVAEKTYYIPSTIPVKQLYPEVEDQPDVTTMGVVAILCTSTRVSSDVVYALTREIFENFETFRIQHPALSRLTKEGILAGQSAPLHPGALRYFREAGLMF
jgi:TRAP transporter TAXI family solute receptor